jgi:hypothetical protein
VDALTPYAAHLLVNALLTAEWEAAEKSGDAPQVGPQRMYGLAKNGTVASTCDLGDGPHKAHGKCTHVMFDGDEFAAWARRYIERVLNGTSVRSQVDVNALVAQYRA